MSSNIMKIALLGMSEKSATTFSFFIRKQAAHLVSLANKNNADIYITDFDTEAGISEWHEYCRVSNKPAIILSIEDPAKPNNIWIKKPVSSQQLLTAIPQLIELSHKPKVENDETEAAAVLAEQNTAEAKENSKIVPLQIVSGGKAKAKKGYKREFSDDSSPNLSLSKEEIAESCGSRADMDIQHRDFARFATYNENNTLLATIKEAIRLANDKQMVVYLEGLPLEFAVLPNEDRIYVDLSDRRLRHLCAMPLQVPIRLKAVKVPMSDYRTTFPIASKHMPSHEQVIWQVALWSSRGRLAQSINPNSKLSLPAWPNFTRVQVTPYAVQIAALWTQHSLTANELAETLGIPQRYVYAIASASHAIGLLKEEKVSALAAHKIDWRPKSNLFNNILRSLRIA